MANIAKGKRGARDAYFPTGFFSMQSDPMIEALAASENLTPQTRLLLLAQSRMNRWGHCPFRQGELLSLVGKDRKTVKSAMDALIQAGIFSPDSTAACLVLPARAYRRNDRATQHCTEEKHFNRQERMWVDKDFGWEEYPGQWHEYLADHERKSAIAAGNLNRWEVTAREVEQETTIVRTKVREVKLTPLADDNRCPRHGEYRPCLVCITERAGKSLG
jgi:hypothetical protein